jgi:hypothetical protein
VGEGIRIGCRSQNFINLVCIEGIIQNPSILVSSDENSSSFKISSDFGVEVLIRSDVSGEVFVG